MIIEMRTHKLKPGKRAEFLQLFAPSQFRRTTKSG
jgi:hypothetical protein